MAKSNFTGDRTFGPLREKEDESGFPARSFEYRLRRLEDRTDDSANRMGAMDAKLDKLGERFQDMAERMARIEGMVSRIPTAQQLWAMTIGSWIAGAGIVLVAVRLLAS